MNEINKNEKIFLTIIFNNSNNYKKIINNINFQTYKNYYCLFILEDKILYNKINEYISLLNLNIDIFVNNNFSHNINNNFNNNISYLIEQFFKSDCNYFTWIYDNYNINYFFLENLIKLKSSFVYTSFKLINNNTNIILLDKKYKSKDDFLTENNISFKSFMWNKETLYKICNNEFILQKNIEKINEYDFFYITFKMIDFNDIKYSNKILLEIIYDNDKNYKNNKNNKNNIIYLDNEKDKIINKYFKNNKIINNNILHSFLPEINNLQKIPLNSIENNNNNNIIISLTSIPPRFLDVDFEDTIKSLFNQIIEPKYIILNLCNSYNRFPVFDNNLFQKKIDFLKNKYSKLIINITIDYGPITKILGLYNLKYNTDINIDLNINDKIIIVDDDWTYSNTLTYYYNLTYELYDCAAIFIDEKHLINWEEWWEKKEFNEEENIIYNNYQGFAFGWLSYSIKYKYINKLFDYYSYIITINENIINYDDLIISLFYKKFKLNTCGLNLLFLKKKTSILDTIEPLRNINNFSVFKNDLEKMFLNIDNINNDLFDIFSINKYENYNTKDIKNIKFNNNNILDISYFNENILILTIFNDKVNNNLDNEYLIEIDDAKYKVIIKNKNKYIKNTYFIKLDNLKKLEIKL